MPGSLLLPSLLQTSTSARRWPSRVGRASAASTLWAPTRARGTRCSVGAATMPTRMGPSVWVRPTTSLPTFCPIGGFPGSLAHRWPCLRESPGLRVPCSPSLADVNECETGVHQCGEGQVCHNLPGSYRCDCKAGFQRDAFGRACVGRWALVAGKPSVGSACPGPALKLPPPSCWPCPLPCSAIPLCSGLLCFSWSWSHHHAFLPRTGSVHPSVSPQPLSVPLAAFLFGPCSCCLSCSLSRFLP